MTKKKKIIVLSCMIGLLAVTAVFNFVMTGTTTSSTETSTVSTTDYFTAYRNERISTRNEEILQLNEIISKADTSSVEYKEALAMKTDLTSISEKELLLENLIKAYGFEDCVVVIGLDSNNVNVVTKSTELTQSDAVKIYSVICDEKIASPENVKIIPIS